MLNGVIPAVVLPMNSRFEPDFDEYTKYLKWVKSARVTGVAVNVDTGEGPTLSRTERKEVVKTAKKALGETFLVAGILGSSTDSAIQSAKDAKAAGANAGLVFPNSAFFGIPLSPDGPVEYHRRISEETGLDIILFQLQAALGGVEYSRETLIELSRLKRVIAIKDALFDAKKFLDTMRLFRQFAPDVSFLTGNDNFIYESFVLGCDGALIGFGTLPVTDLVTLFDIAKRGDVKDALEIQRRIQGLADVIYAPPVRNYRARTKYALAEMGVIGHDFIHMRPPLSQVSDTEKRDIRRALKASGQI